MANAKTKPETIADQPENVELTELEVEQVVDVKLIDSIERRLHHVEQMVTCIHQNQLSCSRDLNDSIGRMFYLIENDTGEILKILKKNKGKADPSPKPKRRPARMSPASKLKELLNQIMAEIDNDD